MRSAALADVTPTLPSGVDPRLADAIAAGAVVVDTSSLAVRSRARVICARSVSDGPCREVGFVAVRQGRAHFMCEAHRTSMPGASPIGYVAALRGRSGTPALVLRQRGARYAFVSVEHLDDQLFGVRVSSEEGPGRILRDGRRVGMRWRTATAYAVRIIAWLRAEGLLVLDGTTPYPVTSRCLPKAQVR